MLARQRDLSVLPARLTSWLRSKYREANDIAVAAPTKPSAGVSNETLLFDVTVRTDGRERRERLVVRLTPSGSPVFPEYDLQRQFRVLQCLSGTNVPVPEPLWFESDATVLGSPFYVMRAIAGEIPSEVPPYHTFGHCLSLTPAERAAMWWSGIEMLAHIHACDWHARGLGFLGVPADPAAALDRQLDYYERFFEWARSDRPQPILDAALAWLKKNRYVPRRVGLCWGDSRLPNLIFRDQRVVGVLDWEMAFIGDPEADLAWWNFLDWSHSDGVGIPRLEGLPSPAETVARYEEISGHRVEHLRYQEIMAAFRYGVITVRVARLLHEAGVSIASADMETNNTCTQRLAALLDLPPPGPPPREATATQDLTARVQFHLTGAGATDWYIVVDKGQGSRHPGSVSNPDVTLTADSDDWRAIQTGELNRTQAFLGGKLKLEGDVSLLLQLEDLLSKLNQ